jgi:hypothetical protein
MSWFDRIKALFGAGPAGGGRGRKVYVVDGGRLFGQGSGGRLSPRDQIHVLQQLSRFAEREGVSAQVVFEGRPLREVDHGGTFGVLRVFFAENGEALAKTIIGLARARGAVVVTGDRQIEQQAAAVGAETMRANTLRRAMDGDGSDRGGGQGPRPPRRRQRGGRGDRGDRPRPPEQPAQEKPAEPAPPSGSGPQDSVRDLIDLVE